MATTLQDVKNKKMDKVTFAKQIEKMRDRDSELVTGIFNNMECPGGGISFMFALYPGEEYKDYYLRDGERYTIPRGVARHLNNGCFTKEYAHQQGQGQFGEQGIRIGASANDGRMKPMENMQIIKKKHRFIFKSLEFMDEDLDMYASNIVEVKMA